MDLFAYRVICLCNKFLNLIKNSNTVKNLRLHLMVSEKNGKKKIFRDYFGELFDALLNRNLSDYIDIVINSVYVLCKYSYFRIDVRRK